MDVRVLMAPAGYPNIQDERTTVLFVIRGLPDRANMAQNVPLLLTLRPATLKDLATTLDILSTVERRQNQRPKEPHTSWPVPRYYIQPQAGGRTPINLSAKRSIVAEVAVEEAMASTTKTSHTGDTK